jgi:hypothetical protein
VRDDKAVREFVLALAKKSPKEQLKAVRAEGLCVKILTSGRKVPKGFFLWQDAEKPSGKLSDVTSRAALMGKTLCKGEHKVSEKCTTIALASDAPRVTLIHEYLHVQQIEKDGEWCELSKTLWKRRPNKGEERELQDREWDVLVALWKNRGDLNLDAQDRVTVAGEILEMAPQRKHDKSAARFVDDEKVQDELMSAAAEYQKGLKR